MFSGLGTPFSSALEIAGVGPDAAVRARGNNILYTCYRIQSSAAPSDSELLDGARIAEVNENSLVVRATQPQPTKGFTITRPGKRLKSRSADHSSRTPCCWHRAAMRASWTCGPAIRPLARITFTAPASGSPTRPIARGWATRARRPLGQKPAARASAAHRCGDG